MVAPYARLCSRLSMRHLRLLAALSHQGSLRRAAAELSLTQPAATKILHELEELVGQPMFLRHARGLRANIVGEAAMRFARLVFTDLQALHAEVEVLEHAGIGHVRLGSMASQTTGIVARVLARLKAEVPGINISVVEETSDRLVELIRRDEIDLAVARLPDRWTEGDFTFASFGEERISVAVRAGHRLLAAKGVGLDALVAQSWIVQPEPAPLRQIYEQLFREANLPLPASMIETASTLLTVSLLDASDMLALLPDSLIDFYAGLGLLAALDLPLAARLRPYGLIRRRNRPPTPAMHRVAEAFVHMDRVG